MLRWNRFQKFRRKWAAAIQSGEPLKIASRRGERVVTRDMSFLFLHYLADTAIVESLMFILESCALSLMCIQFWRGVCVFFYYSKRGISVSSENDPKEELC